MSAKIDYRKCIGCKTCYDLCPEDIFTWNEETHMPYVSYPEECWFDGCCVESCPIPGALRMEFPMNQRVGWKRKTTGEYFRIGMQNPPPPNERPPLG